MWITNENFDMFKKMVDDKQMTLVPMDDVEFKVAADTLDSKQMKELNNLNPAKFKVYANKKRKPSKIKYEFIKEKYYDDNDIVPLIKSIISNEDRYNVMRQILDSGINPIVIQLWLLRPCMADTQAWDNFVLAEEYVYSLHAYAIIVADPCMLGAKFCFPKKLRSE